MSKRTATTELTHDNWNDEDEPEEAGEFKRASDEDLKKRQIRTARRRGVNTGEQTQVASPSVFAGFSGFKKSEPVAPKAVFSFLVAPNGSGAKSESTLSATTPDPTAANSAEPEKKSINGLDSAPDTSSKANDKEYLRKLKGLNESVSKWISLHVASNPLVILTPVFRDYERHLATIQAKAPQGYKSSESLSTSEESTRTSEHTRNEISLSDEVNQISSTEPAVKAENKSTEEKKTFSSSIFGSSTNSSASANVPATFSFGSSGSSTQFCFGSPSSSNSLASTETPTFSFGTGTTTSPSAGFSFGTSKPFTFANVASTNNTEDNKKDDNDDGDEDETPPKPDHKPVNEDGATYTKRCSVFIKQGKEYSSRGIGNLFLKPVDGGKTQLIVRADTSLGNVLLNFIVGSSLPIQRLGKNNVAVVCIPTPDAQPPPVTVLLRVKTSEDADELFSTLEKHKKESA